MLARDDGNKFKNYKTDYQIFIFGFSVNRSVLMYTNQCKAKIVNSTQISEDPLVPQKQNIKVG